VDHNHYYFTIRCFVNEFLTAPHIIGYFNHIANSLPHKQAQIIETATANCGECVYLAYLTLEVRDYGVGQAGIDIAVNFIREIYSDCSEDRGGFHIDIMVVYHNRKGAIIRWNYQLNEPIVEEISL